MVESKGKKNERVSPPILNVFYSFLCFVTLELLLTRGPSEMASRVVTQSCAGEFTKKETKLKESVTNNKICWRSKSVFFFYEYNLIWWCTSSVASRRPRDTETRNKKKIEDERGQRNGYERSRCWTNKRFRGHFSISLKDSGYIFFFLRGIKTWTNIFVVLFFFLFSIAHRKEPSHFHLIVSKKVNIILSFKKF